MSEEKDIRWQQRFSNFTKTLKKFTEAIDYINLELKKEIKENSFGGSVLEEIIKEGLIQRFEYTYEMAWNVMKDYAYYQGNTEIGGSRDAIRFAFSTKLIADGDLWMDMIKSRIRTSHTYDEKIANEIFLKIINDYHDAFIKFHESMSKKLTN